MRAHGLRKGLNGLLVAGGLLLLGSSPFPGGCGSNVKQSVSYVNEGCDTIANGQAPPGCGSTVTETCDTSVNGKLPAGCDDRMAAPDPLCPSGYPLGCGNGKCCPSGFPTCCGDSNWCGTDSSACQAVNNPGAGGSSSGSGNGSGSGSGSGNPGGGQYCTPMTALCSAVSDYEACASGDASGNCTAWYVLNGSTYPCAGCSDCTAAANQVANVITNDCSGGH